LLMQPDIAFDCFRWRSTRADILPSLVSDNMANNVCEAHSGSNSQMCGNQEHENAWTMLAPRLFVNYQWTQSCKLVWGACCLDFQFSVSSPGMQNWVAAIAAVNRFAPLRVHGSLRLSRCTLRPGGPIPVDFAVPKWCFVFSPDRVVFVAFLSSCRRCRIVIAFRLLHLLTQRRTLSVAGKVQ
jgi:hypothetical protein